MSQHRAEPLAAIRDLTSSKARDTKATGKQTKHSILAVDDEQGLLDSYVHYLSNSGTGSQRPALRSSRRKAAASPNPSKAPGTDYQVLTATTGKQAVELVRDIYQQGSRIDVGFFDMKMPGGIDGLETIRQLLEIDPDLYCVIVTAYQDKPLEELAKVFGDDRKDQCDYISKPFTGNEIIQKASNLIAAAERRRNYSRLEQGLLSSIDRFESDAEVRARELAGANRQLHAKQTALQGALDKLVETNMRLQQEIKEKSRIARELQVAQKLEAVGQLAAGIAHEINTPTQYIGNNIHFLVEAFGDLQAVVSKFKEAYEARSDVESCHRLLLAAEKEADEVDIGFLYEEIPDAFSAISQGITTISTIVGAMRNFAHPDSDLKELGDINERLRARLPLRIPSIDTWQRSRATYKTSLSSPVSWVGSTKSFSTSSSMRLTPLLTPEEASTPGGFEFAHALTRTWECW